MIKGYATPEGTEAFKRRFEGKLHDSHFREFKGLFFSSLGIGSYLGDPDDATDLLYERALKAAVASGVNVIDAAINYRCQRSERSFGRALAELISSGVVNREEVIVCTKGGFLPFDSAYPDDPLGYFRETYMKPGLLNAGDLVEGCHAMTPAFLEDQLHRSRANWGVETLDIYYIHNPETQLSEIDRLEFRKRMIEVFRWMEEKVREGKIRMYGTATWDGYRAAEDEQGYLSLEDLHLAAREAGGTDHHFKVVQAPLNLAMPELWVSPSQRFGAGGMSLVDLASRLGVAVIASASLLQARLTGELPDFLAKRFTNLEKSSQRALQFVRSVPGVVTALAGMRSEEHVRENIAVAAVPPLTQEELIALFQNA